MRNKKMYVIRNTKNEKFWNCRSMKWTADIYEAETYDQKWVDEREAPDFGLDENEKFVEISIKIKEK